ncbi:MAG: glycosyltransferase family 39 protein, partial [Anaerolineae bacterium]|nr:glycosyltransferase family 39 protein [Anaerolineae bacterium]
MRLRHHWPLAVILGIFLCLATTFSGFLPLGEAADETDHFALVRFIAEHGRPPLTIAERNAIGPKGDASPVYHTLVAWLSQHVDLTPLPELPETQANLKRLIPTDGFKANRVFHTEDELFPWRGVVLAWHLARLVSVPLGAITIIAAYLTVLHLVPQRRDLAVATAAFVAFLPRFIINSAVVSDDALVVPLVALSIYGMVRIVRGFQECRAFLLLGLLMGLAAITKYHSLVLLPEATLLCIVLAWRTAAQSPSPRQAWLAWLRRWAWMIVAFTLTAGWWFAFLIIRFNQVAELGWVRGLITPFGDPVLTTGLSRLLEMPISTTPSGTFGWDDWAALLFRSFWLTYGWLHIFAPTWVYWALGVWCLLAAAGWGAWLIGRTTDKTGRRAKWLHPSAWRWDIIILALHILIYLGIVVLRQASRPARETAQGRHLYPALTAIAFFIAYGLSALPGVVRGLVRSTRPCLSARGETQKITDENRVQVWNTAWLFALPAALLVLSVATLPSIILPNYLPYLPIRTLKPKEVPVAHRLDLSLAPGLRFLGYDMPMSSDTEPPSFEAGTGIPITLHWYAKAPQTRDYLVRLCLQSARGNETFCLYTHPLDGRYPIRAWEAGYWIRDEVTIPTSACLPEGSYALTLELLPLQMDSAATRVDPGSSRHEPVVLGLVRLMASSRRETAMFPHIEVWTVRGPLSQEILHVSQLRQGFMIFLRQRTKAHTEGENSWVWLTARGDPAQKWWPVASQRVCEFPEGEEITAHSFITDASVRPGEYVLRKPEGTATNVRVHVVTRWRDFDAPARLVAHQETVVFSCDEGTAEPC